jgi:hypothetical protein
MRPWKIQTSRVNISFTRWQRVCAAVVNKLYVCGLYYETISIYCITFTRNSVTVVLLRNNTFQICFTFFCRTDPFLLFLKKLLGKGTPVSEKPVGFLLRVSIQQVLHFLSTAPDDMWFLNDLIGMSHKRKRTKKSSSKCEVFILKLILVSVLHIVQDK